MFAFVLVPLTLAYFFVFLFTPVMNVLEFRSDLPASHTRLLRQQPSWHTQRWINFCALCPRLSPARPHHRPFKMGKTCAVCDPFENDPDAHPKLKKRRYKSAFRRSVLHTPKGGVHDFFSAGAALCPRPTHFASLALA